MATTGFWPVKGRLKEVIDYANNPDKTTAKEYLDEDLYAAIRYVENDSKTDHTAFVTGINCSKHNAYNEMIAVKRRFGERGKNIAYHGYQSFAEGEVTPEEAHQIGVETARMMWGAKYQVVVTTHLNTDNIHNHFVINSVSFTDGKKFRNSIGDRLELRKISDEICAERSKSVIESHKFYSNKKAYWAQKAGHVTHREMLRRDVEEALSQCINHIEFVAFLKALGYTFTRDFNYEHPSVISSGWSRSVRLSSLNEKYTKENLFKRFRWNHDRMEQIKYRPPKMKRKPLLDFERYMQEAEQMDGFQLVFALIVELFKICTGNNVQEADSRPVSPMIRTEASKADKYMEEYWLLRDHYIESPQELLSFQQNKAAQIAELEQKRYELRLRIRRVKTPEEEASLKEQCKELTKKMTPLRKQLKISLRIEQHIPRIKELLDAEREIELKNNGLIQKKEKTRTR